MDLTAGKPFAGALLALLAASTALAQMGDDIPHASYYAASAAIYTGEYRSAARELARETQRGIHTTTTRWIDSVCYYAMYGEALYHQGRNAEALAQFDEACQVLLAYPNWMLQVRFQQNPRADANRSRRVPMWGRSQRTFVIGQFSTTEQVLIGDLDAQKTIQQGGVYRAPMLLRVNVIEVNRMAALAIRRRNEILGPLAAQDPINKQLSAALAAGNLAPANHWSHAWIDLLRGLAQEGAGKLDEADNLLGRSLVIDGQFDHPLTCVALMEQGHIAALKGDTRRAAQMFAEAGYSAFYFEDWDILTEATLGGWLNHIASGAAGVYPPLDPIAAWAQTNRLQHVATKLRLAQAESLLWLNQVAAAASIIDDIGKRIGEMRTGLPGVHLLYVQAALQIVQGRFDVGGEALARALAAQAGVSLRNFQITRLNDMYDSRAASPRVALELYNGLLADPSPADWLRNPVDAMAVIETGHNPAYDRWFLAALERKDPPLALEVAERSKRRRFLATQPLGARLLALRAILESPEADLSREGLTQRQQLLGSFPEYRKLADAGRQIFLQLQAGTVLATGATDAKPLNALYDQWDRNATDRQHILTQLAVRRLPSSLEFPPMRTAPELQKTLAAGEALVVFHAVGENVYGFGVSKTAVNIWQTPHATQLRNGLGNFLRALGNYGANRDLSVAELKSGAWRDAAKLTYAGIFKDSHLNEGKTTGLIIVPDNLLWYLPFEALIPGGGKGDKTLADLFPIRYGPTAGLAVSNPRPLRRPQHTGILPGDMKFAGEQADRDKLLQELVGAVAGPLVLPQPLNEPARLVSPLLDGLVSLDDIQGDTLGEPAFLFSKSRGASKEKTNTWITLPFGGPERLVITGFKTEAQQGLKTPRRETSRTTAARKPTTAPGDDIFVSLCNLMSSGARSILLTRWRTGGRTNFDLVREFAKESADSPAAEAWQRACLLARESPLDLAHEPRLKKAEDTGDMPTADHPFFWAGYLVVDTGPRVEKPENPEVAKKDGVVDKKIPPPVKPGEGGDKLPPPKTNKEPAADKKSNDAAAEGVAPPKKDEEKAGDAKSK
jgi:tetratricopeptide (TPR) repeat protein